MGPWDHAPLRRGELEVGTWIEIREVKLQLLWDQSGIEINFGVVG